MTPSRPYAHPILGWALLVVLLAPAVPGARAGIELPKTYYRDPVHKFSFKIFDKWKQVPVEAGETIRVARFVEGGAPRGMGLTPTLSVVRINKREGGDEPAITGATPEQIRRFLEARNPKSAWAATVTDLCQRVGLPEDEWPKQGEFKKVKSKDKIEGKLWALEIPYGRMGGGRDVNLFLSLVAFEKDEVEYGIFFQSTSDRRKSYERGMAKLAKTFRFFDKKAKDVETYDALEDVNITPERRRQIERSMVKGWNVIVSPKKNYVVVYNTKKNKNHKLAKEIARRIELIREQVYEVQFPPAQKIEAVSIVRVCGDRKEYHGYGGPGGSAGYWNSGSEELVFYDAAPGSKIDYNTISVLYHEAFHQYIFYSSGDVAPHSWFNEGHGDYYAGADLKGKKFTIKPFRWRQGIIKNAVAKGPREKIEDEDPKGNPRTRYANDGGYTPLVDLVRFTQREYYSYPGVCYAQGWSFIYFLREVVPKSKKYRAKWGHILDVYFDTLKREAGAVPPVFAGGGDDDPGNEKGDEEDDASEPDDDAEDDVPGEDEEDDDGDAEDEEIDPATYIPPMMRGRFGGRDALEKAVKAAFEGVDFDELEQAWVKSV